MAHFGVSGAEGPDDAAPTASAIREPASRRWRLESVSGRSRRVVMAAAVLLFVAVGVYGIRDFPRGAIDHARWWLLAITCLFGPLPTVALNGAEYIAQARTVGVRVPFLEGIRVSILATAANLLPVPGSALVRTHALASGGSGYRRATMTTLAVGTAWIGATATLVAEGQKQLAN